MTSEPIATSTPRGGFLCPACRVPLVMSERQNIEIEYCPDCRGVWLDRGELDKIIERSAKAALRSPAADRAPDDRDSRSRGGYDVEDRERGRHGHRRKSWLGELFD